MLTSKILNGINGNIIIPGDKSISHRSIIIPSISNGISQISNLLFSEDVINTLNAFISMGAKIKVNKDQKELIKDLSKQLEHLNVKSILEDESRNIIKDETINGTKVRLQKVEDLPPKDLRKLVDSGKKILGDGIVIVFASKDDKVGLAVGVTDKLIEKYDAVKFAKIGSEIIGGKGGGGRKDFAQAGGQDANKIEEAFEKLKSLV